MNDHYFSSQPHTASKPRTITVRLAGRDVDVTTDAGVFSPSRLDPGTAVLLKNLPAPPAGDILDLGCGWGPISLQAGLEARDDETDVRVWALDVNERSLSLTRENAKAAGLTSITPVLAQDIPDSVQFSAIWSNPPIRVGKDVLHELLLTWLPRLVPGGEAWLVVSKNLGADSLATWMSANLPGSWDVRREASSKGFRVLVVRKLEAPEV